MESTTRRNEVARAILTWLYDEDDNYPVVEAFLERTGSHVDGGPVSNDELIRTVRWLDDRRLIDGPRIDQAPYPVKLALTAGGRNIVVEQDGWVLPDAVPDRTPTEDPLVSTARARTAEHPPCEGPYPAPHRRAGPGARRAGRSTAPGQLTVRVRRRALPHEVHLPRTGGARNVPVDLDVAVEVSLTRCQREMHSWRLT